MRGSVPAVQLPSVSQFGVYAPILYDFHSCLRQLLGDCLIAYSLLHPHHPRLGGKNVGDMLRNVGCAAKEQDEICWRSNGGERPMHRLAK